MRAAGPHAGSTVPTSPRQCRRLNGPNRKQATKTAAATTSSKSIPTPRRSSDKPRPPQRRDQETTTTRKFCRAMRQKATPTQPATDHERTKKPWPEARRNERALFQSTTGTKARAGDHKVLRHFGCERIGFMDDFEKQEVLLAFKHRGRQVQLHASAKGWAELFLKGEAVGLQADAARVRNTSRMRLGRATPPSTACSVTGSRGRSPQSNAASFRLKRCSCPSC